MTSSLTLTIAQAKVVLGLSSSLKPEEVELEEVHEKFIQQLAKVFHTVSLHYRESTGWVRS